jgi:hypothetical protein
MPSSQIPPFIMNVSPQAVSQHIAYLSNCQNQLAAQVALLTKRLPADGNDGSARNLAPDAAAVTTAVTAGVLDAVRLETGRDKKILEIKIDQVASRCSSSATEAVSAATEALRAELRVEIRVESEKQRALLERAILGQQELQELQGRVELLQGAVDALKGRLDAAV